MNDIFKESAMPDGVILTNSVTAFRASCLGFFSSIKYVYQTPIDGKTSYEAPLPFVDQTPRIVAHTEEIGAKIVNNLLAFPHDMCRKKCKMDDTFFLKLQNVPDIRKKIMGFYQLGGISAVYNFIVEFL